MKKFLVAFMLALLSGQATARVEFGPDNVGDWADDYFARATAEKRFAGAVVTVVQDGQIVFAKGYGYADIALGTPVDPATTRFRIGSTTKTFTATAIAQLMDRGLIKSLDDPANLYLKRETLPSVNGQDITLRDLITHRGGFASRAFHIGSDTSFDLPLSAEIVQSHRPPVVRPAGGRAVYSNYSTTMLGIIVEDITGMKIDDYFKEYIFDPLGMNDAVLNMTPSPTPELAQSYAFLPNGDIQEVPHWGVNPFFAPAGAINATGVDMAKYMIAHLNAGKDGVSPLKISPDTFDLMHTRMADNNPAAQGFGMIFLTLDWAGKTSFGHGGDWPGFHSLMWMMPEDNAGVFVSLMAEAPNIPVFDSLVGAEYLTPAPDAPVLPPLSNIGFMINFLGHFYGPDTPGGEKGRLNVDDLVGSYRHEYRAYETIEAFLDFLNGPYAVMQVTRDEGDTIRINGKGPYQQVASGVFWNPDMETGPDGSFTDSALWAFTWDNTEDRYLLTPRISIDPFVKVTPWQNPLTYSTLLMVMLPLLLSGFLAIFWKADESRTRVSKWLAVALPLSFLMVPVSLFFGYGKNGSFLADFLLGHPGHFLTAILFANLVAVLTLAAAYHVVQAWRHEYWGTGWRPVAKRAHFSVVSLAGLGMVIFLCFYNFIGFNLT